LLALFPPFSSFSLFSLSLSLSLSLLTLSPLAAELDQIKAADHKLAAAVAEWNSSMTALREQSRAATLAKCTPTQTIVAKWGAKVAWVAFGWSAVTGYLLIDGQADVRARRSL
jgi:outer membrane murein-binding lipoprotein Lpp